MTAITLGTRNPNKLRELRQLVDGLGLSLSPLPEAVSEVVEDHPTIRGNAVKKAVEYARAIGGLCLADDSGLLVDALDGAPGVISARFSGPGATPERNNDLLLERLRGKPESERGAHFLCALALADPQGVLLVVAGRCPGRILEARRGSGGFGYDPLFLEPSTGRSFAELSPAEKNALSHRGRALQKLVAALPAVLDL